MKPKRSLHELEEERVVPWSDGGHYAWHRARYELALAHARGKRVLDLGSGEGYGAALLAPVASEVIGVDYSPVAVEHAGRSYSAPGLSFKVADATVLPSDLGTFELITAFELIEHLEDDLPFLTGIARLLRPTGLVMLSTPNALIETLVQGLGHSDRYEYHVNSLTPRSLRRRLRRFFGDVTLCGQSVRGNRFHTLIKAADVFNVRHRLVRSFDLQQALAASLSGKSPASDAPTFRFTRLLARQSPILVATCRRPLPDG